MAKITAEDEAAVPADVLAAYIEARRTRPHVCPATAVNLADHQLSELTYRIKFKYKGDFDAPRDEDIVLIENCPPPGESPDFHKRMNSHWAAIVKLGRLLGCYPSQVDGFLICEMLEGSGTSNQ